MAQEILVSINVNSGKAEVGLNNTTKGVNKLEAAKKKLNYELSEEARELAKVNAAIRDQQLANKNAAASNLQYGQSFSKLNKNQKQFRTQVGLNNAILQEAGRAASDLRFGFNGVANNVGQLASLFGSLVTTSDNVGTSLRNLANSFLGTGGILIGVQLLIAYGDKIAAFFSGSAKEASKFTKEIRQATEAIDEQIFQFDNLTRRVIEYGDIGKLGADANKLLADSFNEFAKALKAIEEGAILNIPEGFDSMFDESETLKGVEAVAELRKRLGELLDVRRELIVTQTRLTATNEEGQLNVTKGSLLELELKNKILDLTRRRIDLENLFNLESKEGTELRVEFDREATFKLYKTREREFDKYAERALRKELSLIERSEIQKLDLEKQFRLRSLKAEADRVFESESIKFREYLKDISLRKDNLIQRVNEKKEELLLEATTEAEKEDIRKKSNSKIVQINSEFRKALLDADQKYVDFLNRTKSSFEENAQAIIDSYGRIQDELTDRQILDDLKMFADESIKGIQDRIKFERKYSREKSTQLKLEQKLLDSVFQQDLANLNAKIAKAKVEGESYEGLIQRKINLEKTYGEETKRITRETDDAVFASKLQLASSIADIMEESSRLAKEGSDLQKGLALTAIAANTSVSMIQGFRLAQEASQGTGPAAPFIAAATYAAQITTLLSAVSQAKSILSSGDVSGIDSSVNVQSPAFNVVGASPLDLLMVDISNKLEKPIPAYVTAKGAIETLDEYYRNVRTGSNN